MTVVTRSKKNNLNITPDRLDPASISDKTSYRKTSWSPEAARFMFRTFRSLWNLIALLPRCLSNFKAMWWFKLPISRLRDFTRTCDKMCHRILKQGHDVRATFALILNEYPTHLQIKLENKSDLTHLHNALPQNFTIHCCTIRLTESIKTTFMWNESTEVLCSK